MEVKVINEDKKRFLDLLLQGDEQENMIDNYLERGQMFALYDGDLKCVCVVTRESEDVYEIKNIATSKQYQRQGYASRLIKYVFGYYKNVCKKMLVGTGDSPSTISFYKSCGFQVSHRVKNFFTDHYDHPIYEDDIQLVDMVYLKKDF